MPDKFYDLKYPSVKKVKNILSWAYYNGLRTDVDVLNCKKSFRRMKSDKSFEEIFELIDKRAIGFFRVIHREKMNLFGILSDHYERRDLLDIFIRNINVGDDEYFFFIYMDVDKLDYLKSKYTLQELRG
jgi:hypothetical protein